MNSRRRIPRGLTSGQLSLVALILLLLVSVGTVGDAGAQSRSETGSASSLAAASISPEPFPKRIIYFADFDNGPKDLQLPGDFELTERPPTGAVGRAARSVPRKGKGGPFIRLGIVPSRPVGEQTKLRLRYHLSGASNLTAQIFDLTVQDNRHLRLAGVRQNEWATLNVDFSRDARRNDGTSPSRFSAGNLVDDLFIFVDGEEATNATLFVDDVVLFDAGP